MNLNFNKLMEIPDGIYLQPGEVISPEIIKELQIANAQYSKTKNFAEYQRSIQRVFHLKPIQPVKMELKFYLAGFLEGEGSLNIGAKKNQSSKFKVYIDPEFNVTQHINGISNLYLAMFVFQTGRIRHKTGSNATFVYTIDNRQSLEEKVIPFYEKYVRLYGSPFKERRVRIFKKLLVLFKEKAHLDVDGMIHEVLPLWDTMRMQKGQSNETFRSLEEAQQYVKAASLCFESQNKL